MQSSSTSLADLLPGYYVEPSTGAWLTLPWPDKPEDLPPSLGLGVIRWIERWLVHHQTGEPFRLTVGQKRFIVLWYALRPDGRWLYRRGVKRMAKGAGKDPLLAALALAELCGPVVLDQWDAPGRPVGRPHRLALVQIGANSEAQAKKVLRVANGLVSEEMRTEYGYDAGEIQSQASGGSRVELLTNSERSAEGDPATAIFLNESHHMTESSGGQRLARVARRNAAKSPGGQARVLEATNAHVPGEDSVGEGSYSAWQAQVSGRTRRVDILYDSREAPPHLRLHVEEELEAGIAAAYADSPWSPQETLRDEAQDPDVPVQDAVRYYFNALPTNEFAWVDPRRWDALADTSKSVADREQVALFLDCSKSTDATALVACRVSDGHVVGLRGWQRPHGDRGRGWLAPRHEVDAEVRAADDRWQVVWFGVDPSPAKDDETEASYWGELVDAWHRHFRDRVTLWASPGQSGSAVAFDMRLSVPGGRDRNRLFTEAAERVAADVDAELDPRKEGSDRLLTHDGSSMLRQHVHNARRRPNQWGVTLGKRTRDSSQLVDMAVAMVGARMGRRLVLNSGKLAKPRTGRAVFW